MQNRIKIIKQLTMEITFHFIKKKTCLNQT